MTPKRLRPQGDGLPFMKAFREARRMEQADIADYLGVARQQVSRWERGETSPSVWDALELARVLGTTVERLALGPTSETIGEPAELAQVNPPVQVDPPSAPAPDAPATAKRHTRRKADT